MPHEQRTEEWFAARKGKITASIAAGCLGLCPYTSRQKAWRTIMGTQANATNKHMDWGTEFEPVAKNAYECLTGNIVTETGFHPHPSIPWLGASPDGLIGTDGLSEIKCPGKLPEIVPVHHRIQMIVQMACTGREWCDYFVWTHDGHFLKRVYPSGVAGILARLEAFYKTFVLTATEPPRKKPKRRVPASV